MCCVAVCAHSVARVCLCASVLVCARVSSVCAIVLVMLMISNEIGPGAMWFCAPCDGVIAAISTVSLAKCGFVDVLLGPATLGTTHAHTSSNHPETPSLFRARFEPAHANGYRLQSSLDIRSNQIHRWHKSKFCSNPIRSLHDTIILNSFRPQKQRKPNKNQVEPNRAGPHELTHSTMPKLDI